MWRHCTHENDSQLNYSHRNGLHCNTWQYIIYVKCHYEACRYVKFCGAATTLSIMTFNKMTLNTKCHYAECHLCRVLQIGATTLSIMTLSKWGLHVTFSISDTQHNNAECHVLVIVMLNVIMLIVVAPVNKPIMLSAFTLKVVAPILSKRKKRLILALHPSRQNKHKSLLQSILPPGVNLKINRLKVGKKNVCNYETA